FVMTTTNLCMVYPETLLDRGASQSRSYLILVIPLGLRRVYTTRASRDDRSKPYGGPTRSVCAAYSGKGTVSLRHAPIDESLEKPYPPSYTALARAFTNSSAGAALTRRSV